MEKPRRPEKHNLETTAENEEILHCPTPFRQTAQSPHHQETIVERET